MIHPSLRLEYLKNKKFKYSSLDSFSKCVNKIHFIKYKKKFTIHIIHGGSGMWNGHGKISYLVVYGVLGIVLRLE